jgi:hypothetical protein
MSTIHFANIPPHEVAVLKLIGITEEAEGLSVSDNEQWEWLDASGNPIVISERMDLLTLSSVSGISEDEWHFCRLKISDEPKFVYLIDASLSADSYIIGGVGSADEKDALEIFRRIISWEDARLPGRILIHSASSFDSESISSIYKGIEYYQKSAELFFEELKSCKILKSDD